MNMKTETWVVIGMLSIIIASISIATYPRLSGPVAAASIIVCIGAMVGFVVSVNFAFDRKESEESAKEKSFCTTEKIQERKGRSCRSFRLGKVFQFLLSIISHNA